MTVLVAFCGDATKQGCQAARYVLRFAHTASGYLASDASLI
jgi:hypothetical protein